MQSIALTNKTLFRWMRGSSPRITRWNKTTAGITRYNHLCAASCQFPSAFGRCVLSMGRARGPAHFGLLAFLAEASRHLLQPLAELQLPLSLAPAHLPEYAARTTLRMLLALVFSLALHLHLRDACGQEPTRRACCWCRCSTFCSRCRSSASSRSPSCSSCRWRPAACWARNSPPSSRSSPARPGTWPSASISRCARCRSSWSKPRALSGCPRWMQFWRVEAPFAMPQLIWNMMVSMSGSWFFVVASEAISVGNTTVTLPGVGSYIALAIEQKRPRRRRLGDRRHAGRHPALRSAAVPAAGRLGRPLSFRAAGRRRAAAILGARRDAPLAASSTVPHAVRLWRELPAALVRPLSPASGRDSRLSRSAELGRPRRWRMDRCRSPAAVALWQVVRFVFARAFALADVGAALSLLGFATLTRDRRSDRDRQRDLGADRRCGRHAAAS